METTYVHSVYKTIAADFDRTRRCIWAKVGAFLLSIHARYAMVADVGCGNGKYIGFGYRVCGLNMVGFDMCQELLNVADRKSNIGCVRCNGLNIPVQSGTFDAAISIAVLHHLSTHDERVAFVREIVRIMRPGARGLLCVWAQEQENPSKTLDKWTPLGNGDYLVPWNGSAVPRFYHLFKEGEVECLFKEAVGGVICITGVTCEKSNWYLEWTKAP